MAEQAPTPVPALPGRGVLLRAAVLPALSTGALGVAVSAFSSRAALWGAVIGTAVAVVAFGLPMVIMRVAENLNPPAVMSLALVSYLILVMIFGALYAALDGASWVSPHHLGWTLLACTVTTTATLMRGARRMRVLVYDEPAPSEPDAAEDRPADGRSHPTTSEGGIERRA